MQIRGEGAETGRRIHPARRSYRYHSRNQLRMQTAASSHLYHTFLSKCCQRKNNVDVSVYNVVAYRALDFPLY